MATDRSSPLIIMLHHLQPGRYLAFQLTTPSGVSLSAFVLDSPSDRDPHIPFAALLVPSGKEGDWIFSSECGHWQLLSSASASRLVVLIRNKVQKLHQEEGSLQGVATSVCSSWKISTAEHRGEGGVSENDRSSSERMEIHYEQVKTLALHRGLQQQTRFTRSRRATGKKKIARNRRLVVQNQIERLVKDEWTQYEGEGGINLCHQKEDEPLKQELLPFLAAFASKLVPPFRTSLVPFVSYDDNILNRVIVDEAYSRLTGKMFVEDVELLEDDRNDGSHQFLIAGVCRPRSKLRRRLRFQRMPNLIQTEVSIVLVKEGQPVIGEVSLARLTKGVEVKVDHSILVHKYLPPIVAGLVLAAPTFEACLNSERKVRVLSIGVGGGALPIFLHEKLGFHVEAVDLDETVLGLAYRHFGLVENEHLRIKIGDGIRAVFDIAIQVINAHLVVTEIAEKWQELMKGCENLWPDSCSITRTTSNNERCMLADGIGTFDPRMNIIVVDVDAGDARLGVSSPPINFLEIRFLLACRISLQERGMLIFNVVTCGARPYNYVISALKGLFIGLYEIEIGAGENHIIFAFPTQIDKIDLDSCFALMLKDFIGDHLFYQINEIK